MVARVWVCGSCKHHRNYHVASVGCLRTPCRKKEGEFCQCKGFKR